MRKLIAPAIMATVVFAGQAFAQTTGSQSDAANDAQRGAGAATGQSGQPSGPSERISQSPGQIGQNGLRQQRTAGQPGQTAGQDALTQHIAAALLLGNQEEIALSQVGVERAENDQVRQFAEQMIEQHQQFVSQLQQAAPQLAQMDLTLRGIEGPVGASDARSPDAIGSPSSQAGARTTPGGQPAGVASDQAGAAAAANGDQQQMVQFMKQVKQQCLHLTTQQLAQKQGEEFDKGFMGVQKALHTGMLAHLQVAKQHVSGGPMAQLIQQGEQTTQEHLRMAQQIMQQLDAEGGRQPRAAAAGEGTTRQ